MDRAVYCRQHGLSIKTFGRWMKHLVSEEPVSLQNTCVNCARKSGASSEERTAKGVRSGATR